MHRTLSRVIWGSFLIGLTWGIPAQTAGVLDLSTWDVQQTRDLNGQWEFFREALPGGATAELVDVPGPWNHLLGHSDGWGTFRLTLRLSDPPPSRLALGIAVINSSSEVLWNGVPVWKTGDWRLASYRPERRSGVVDLPAVAGDNVLEVRVANYGDINGGITESLRLGTVLNLTATRSNEIISTVFLFGCLFIMGVYHLGLFFYRPSDKSPLWFGIMSILLAVRGLVYGPTYFVDVVPWMDWETLMRIGYLTFSAGTLVFGYFIHSLFPEVTPKWFRPGILMGAGGYTLANLVLPAAWYSPLVGNFQLYVGVAGAIICYILGRAVFRKLRGATLFLVGFVLFFGTVVNDILKSNMFLPTPYLSQTGLVAFLVFQSLVMIRKFTAAFADSERYSQHLSRINVSLERFIPREILSYLGKDSIVDIELGDYKEQPMVVMFADIRDFTTLSETMSPRENFQFINSYLRRMGPVVRRHNGFVDKYMGDGIMALFPEAPHDALAAALDMRKALEEYNEHRKSSGYGPIRMGIGLHRGPLMLGTIGENRRMDSTVISDTVNTASRLEGLTKTFKVDILVSEETMEHLSEEHRARFRFEFLGEESVKGRKKLLRVYSLSLP